MPKLFFHGGLGEVTHGWEIVRMDFYRPGGMFSITIQKGNERKVLMAEAGAWKVFAEATRIVTEDEF